MKRASWVAVLGVSLSIAAPAIARADDRPPVVFVDGSGNTVASTTTTTTSGPASTTTVTTTQTVEVVRSSPPMQPPAPTPAARPSKVTWFGLSLGAVATPFATPSYLAANEKLVSNRFRACLQPGDQRLCSSLRGFDVRVQIFNTDGAWDYPRWVGYFRTGYRAGRANFEPSSGGHYQQAEVTSLAYASVPIFFGGSVYAFKRFPIRPFAGLGAGVDVTRASYAKHGQRGVLQTSVRPGFEVHAGIEARLSNFIAVTFEVQQLWSMRRRVEDLPSFSNSALTLMAGVAVSLPSPGSSASLRNGAPRWWRR